MDTLHVQKENVDANVVGNGIAGKMSFAGTDKFSTPRRGFVIHEDTKPTSKTALKDNSTKKSRRVLGDISNKQRNRLSDSNAGDIVLTKKTGLGKGLGHSKKLNAKKRTPLKNKAGVPLTPKALTSLTPETLTLLTSKSAIKPPHMKEVPDIEFAYGGLPSPKAESAYVKGLRNEILQEILNDKTPTLFDDFDPTHIADDCDDSREKAMLESGEPPSPWWASSNPQTKDEEYSDSKEDEDEDQVQDDLNDLPPPDNLPEGAVVNFDDDGLLEDLLNVDVEAVCSE